ncbi:receptor-type tyrosine-protein phosphatase H-like isoform X2 [Clupea harengus]|uniref:protein-tyrosine-phosphatase n=1 Tax=Clupea harengus TaxID=7950 RepID=A0A6P8F163_CLUHA|nr:receptor-type tyrosine-protein phosphatase H-like isoform X2 [Clupea harengus]
MRATLWLVCLCTARVWCQSTSSPAITPTSAPTINPTTITTAAPTTTPRPPPPDVTEVIVKTRNETHIELEWTKVNNINTYILKPSGGTETPITGSDGNTVTHTVSSLSAGTKYLFTLFTVFEGVKSTGFEFSAVTVPSDVDDVTDKESFETHLVLQWTNVNNDTSYNYTLRDSDGNNTFIPGSNGGNTVTHTVPSLSPGTKYTFTLFTVFEGVQSKGFHFSEATVPSAAEVKVTNRAETELTLQWSTVNSTDYILLDSSGENISFSGPLERTMTQTVSSLSPGTEYSFTLRTIFETKTNEYNFSSVTTIDCAASKWTITNFTIKAEVVGLFSTAAATNGTDVTGTVGENKVSFTDLYPGATYNVSLYYQLNQQDLLQCSHSLTLIPAVVTSLHCERGDYSVRLKWEKPFGVWTEVEVNVSGRGSESVSGTELIVSGLQPAQTYSINVASLSGAMRSSPEGISCHTHSTVIWLPVLLIILMGLLTALGVFMLRRKPELLSKVHMPMSKRPTEMQSSQGKFEAIPVKTFSEHFHHMTRDENRELTAEYMGFNTAGADQTQREATLSENMSKNRFTDILPYDSSRVRLNTRGHDSDYINANYIPGYGRKNKEYIATQGPLPSTVSDFWRMIWEQKSGQIVMVTNCIENGKTKCEKYWPQDHTPCRYDDLLITMKSEHKETYWTTREFIVKNEASSEERVIKQFHFTAWPDHGVPYGTETLIQFRGLIRHHIDNSQNPGPTVTHCSAGVGRTGTLIALDVLLQQLEREKAVDIAGFVHSMRCRRPRMVQTESQYLFLHQCIKDHLTEKPVEPLYANAVIYENEEALKQYRSDQIAGR